MVAVLDVRMYQNLPKGLGSANVAIARVTKSLLQSPMPQGLVMMMYQMDSIIRVTSAHVC